jgi:peptide chain release factor 1
VALPEIAQRRLKERADRHAELTDALSSPEFLGDGRRLARASIERGTLQRAADLHQESRARARREEEARSLRASGDADMAQLALEELDELERTRSEFEARVLDELVREPEDERTKVIVEIRAGTGGDEATLFVADLHRIYRRWLEARGLRIEELDLSTSEVGGYKEIIFAVEGEGAWRLLRHESGGHRVQRVPATEAQGRIHTSAATVAVLPEAEEVELSVRPEDLRIDTMRAGGAGGQHVNKTESAVRITHLPTGIVAICQDDRSQQKNKARAMRLLLARLQDVEERRRHAERAAERRSQVGSGDRSERIRTYNWPQNRVTDHRANENFSLEQVLAGKLDPVVEAVAAIEREERLKAL